ncbi:Cytochrome c1-2, heme protein, mitochondrial [Tetrabaena socialis]|uniref:Cytochrome c1-2, heme protein, mitochondrial n=1 Tax=Tetrabaena socialis TaxID=47790 RepID=A0A2J8AGF2_9CHLO|nr:Cytochrome c1-2, heme protein, mitochondrial [Tetrabaena socialis]|eukprot:PNH11603.1 Cytochrome c1-2, heme protein, mitochondrial [Tetrabaena socialis]
MGLSWLLAEVLRTSALQAVPALTAAVSSTASDAEPGKAAHYAAALGGVLAGIFGASCVASAGEAADGLHAPVYPWPHDGVLDSYDHGSIRRGFKVYQQVCAACHSMQYLHWRQLVGVCYTEEEAKELAAETEVREGLYYNPYFPGGAIAMPKMLVDGGVEYDDGTPASASQQAKDVVTFLSWSCYPYQDEMRIMGIKAVMMITILIGFASYSKRLRWAPIKSQRIVMDVVN